MGIHYRALRFLAFSILFGQIVQLQNAHGATCSTTTDLGGTITFRNMLHKPSLERAPVQNVKVGLWKVNAQGQLEHVNEINTPTSGPELGKFCFRNLSVGQKYRLSFEKTGYAISTQSNVNEILFKNANNPVVHAYANRNTIGLYGLAAMWALAKDNVTSIDDPDSQVRGFDFVEATLGSPITSTNCRRGESDTFCVHPGSSSTLVNNTVPNDGFYKALFEKIRSQPGFSRYLPIVQMRLYSSDERRAKVPLARTLEEHQNAVLTVLDVVNSNPNPLAHDKMLIQLDEEILTTKYRTLSTPVVPTEVSIRNNHLAHWLSNASAGKLAIAQSYAPGKCNSFPGSPMHGVPANCSYLDPKNNYAAMSANSILIGAFDLDRAEFLSSLRSSETSGQPAYVQIHFNPMRKPATGMTPIPNCHFWNDEFRLTAYQQIREAFNRRVPIMLYWEALQLLEPKVPNQPIKVKVAWGWASSDRAANKFKERVLNELIPTLQGKNPAYPKLNHLPDAQTMEEVPDFMPKFEPQAGPNSVCE